jgi:hypothetical protein
MTTETINSHLNDLWNFHLVLFGTGLTIFTLIYSFILSKRDDLKLLSDSIKSGTVDPIVTQRESFSRKQIGKLRSVNRHAIFIIVVSFSLFTSSWVAKVFISECHYFLKFYTTLVLASITFFLIIYVLIVFIVIFRQYKEDSIV